MTGTDANTKIHKYKIQKHKYKIQKYTNKKLHKSSCTLRKRGWWWAVMTEWRQVHCFASNEHYVYWVLLAHLTNTVHLHFIKSKLTIFSAVLDKSRAEYPAQYTHSTLKVQFCSKFLQIAPCNAMHPCPIITVGTQLQHYQGVQQWILAACALQWVERQLRSDGALTGEGGWGHTILYSVHNSAV